MLKLLEGGFFSNDHETIKNEIKVLSAEGRRAILIVPEQQTVSAEREMIDTLPPSASVTFEVTNFTRLANTVFRALGGLAKESADSSKRALIMWRVLTELKPTLETVGREINAGTVSRMLTAIKQLRSVAVTPSELLDAAKEIRERGDALTDKRLLSKIEDAAKIMTLYIKLLTERFSDGDEDISVAANKLSTSGSFLSDTAIYVDGFASFTEPQYRMIEALIGITDVTISLTLPKAASGAFEYTEIQGAHTKLMKLAGGNAEVRRTDVTTNAPNPLIADIVSLLFRTTGKVDEDFLEHRDFLTVCEAETPYEECDFVAQDIKKRVMGGGKYSDFGIIARNMSAYEGILDLSFAKAGVPLFLSTRSDIECYEAIKLIYSAYAAIVSGYARQDVMTYAKCSLSGVPDNLVDELELYCECWQITGSRFTDGVTWNMNPDGFTSRKREGTDEKLLRIDETRNMIVGRLTELECAINDAVTVRDHAEALVGFLTSLDLERKLEQKAKDPIQKTGGKDPSGVWKLICNSLDSLVETLGDTECTADTFVNLLKITFSEASLGRIPTFAEQVTAGSADSVRLYGKKHIYIIGATYGAFPAKVDDDSFFTDKDRRAISDCGVRMPEDTEARSAREFYYVLRALSYARGGITLTYPALDTAFKAGVPSEIIGRIEELTGGAISPIRLSSLSSAERVYSAEYALEHLSPSDPDADNIREALRLSGSGARLRVSEGSIRNIGLRLSRESTSRLYGDSIPLSQTNIDSFISCPMSYFCKYDLKLSANERAEFGAANIGSFIHGIIENFFIRLKALGKGVSELDDDERFKIIEEVAEAYAEGFFEYASVTSARIKSTVKKLCRMAKPIIDSLCDEFADCKYEPIFFELGIERESDKLPTAPIFNTPEGQEVYIRGKMDRLDAFRHGDDVYLRVIDYKTGSKSFSLKDIESGQNLQMFLYLKAVTETGSEGFRSRLGLGEGGKIIPAGVIYVKTAIDESTVKHNDGALAMDAVKKKQARLGMLLDDPVSIAAMNPDYIPIKIGNEGEVDKSSLDKVYSLDGWERINETIEAVVLGIAKRMTSGEIDAAPLRKGGKTTACKYCSYKAVCRNANIT